ncbi:MAG: UDP-N-acetylmuramate--L-alanine ligase [Polyangiales bacterium]
MFRGRIRSIHFIGIGGIGMSGVAEVLLDSGFCVTGSDLRHNEAIAHLVAKGAQVQQGHDPQHVQAADVVVYSSAVTLDNPEVMAARARSVPVIARAEMLAELMRLKDGIAIAGSHGKTTTTSLVATVLRQAGLDPTVIIGGRLNALGSGAARGNGPLLVAEADESDGSFLHLNPTVAVITNIDAEHLDHYGDFATLQQSFVDFANRVPFFGLVVACLDHPQLQAVLPRMDKRVTTYGLSAQADYRARQPHIDGLMTRFQLERHGEALGPFEVRMPGMHNVLNALATIAVADELGIDLDVVRRALSGFAGVQRRFSVLGEAAGVMVVDDYGHHPAEIIATLEAAQRAFDRRLVVLFQPHRYSRTAALFGELSQAFNRADVLLVAPIYAAGEVPMAGIDTAALVAAIRAHGHRDAAAVGDLAGAIPALEARLRPGDVVLTLGAGSITQVGPNLLAALRRRPTEGKRAAPS